MATPDRFSAAACRWQSLVLDLIVGTDTAFSSNRFAWAHQIHKLDLQIELKETVMDQLHPTRLLKKQSSDRACFHAGRCQPAHAGREYVLHRGFLR
jgi:hypothetical protein